jgi:hypothetical protein
MWPVQPGRARSCGDDRGSGSRQPVQGGRKTGSGAGIAIQYRPGIAPASMRSRDASNDRGGAKAPRGDPMRLRYTQLAQPSLGTDRCARIASSNAADRADPGRRHDRPITKRVGRCNIDARQRPSARYVRSDATPGSVPALTLRRTQDPCPGLRQTQAPSPGGRSRVPACRILSSHARFVDRVVASLRHGQRSDTSTASVSIPATLVASRARPRAGGRDLGVLQDVKGRREHAKVPDGRPAPRHVDPG